jgi:hypothetical protein
MLAFLERGSQLRQSCSLPISRDPNPYPGWLSDGSSFALPIRPARVRRRDRSANSSTHLYAAPLGPLVVLASLRCDRVGVTRWAPSKDSRPRTVDGRSMLDQQNVRELGAFIPGGD